MENPLTRDTFIWGVATICNLHRVPFDAELLIQRFPPTYDLAVFQAALKAFGFKVARQAGQLQALHPAVFPVLALLNPIEPALAEPVPEQIPTPLPITGAAATNPPIGDVISLVADKSEAGPPIPEYRLALVIKTDGQRVLIATPDSSSPQAVPLAEFNAQFAGHLILATPLQKPVDEDIKAPVKFGFKWFIPELLKHKKIWREILLASFSIQLVALATPLGTQVIIDKVVVHHTVSTLIVIAIALGVSLVFNAIMSWVRQYLVLHTGNRIDAVLAHKVFNHLLHL